jgi:hypothetical protein
MRDFVALSAKRNRGWPWPDDSWGLAPMYGAEGWCRSCCVPRQPRRGSLILQRKRFKVQGAWSSYWHWGICLEAELADEIAAAFRVELMDVKWHASSPGKAREVIAPPVGERWFDEFDVVASPEWFGDGCNAFREILVRRELASIIVAASPRDFRIVKPDWA